MAFETRIYKAFGSVCRFSEGRRRSRGSSQQAAEEKKTPRLNITYFTIRYIMFFRGAAVVSVENNPKAETTRSIRNRSRKAYLFCLILFYHLYNLGCLLCYYISVRTHTRHSTQPTHAHIHAHVIMYCLLACLPACINRRLYVLSVLVVFGCSFRFCSARTVPVVRR